MFYQIFDHFGKTEIPGYTKEFIGKKVISLSISCVQAFTVSAFTMIMILPNHPNLNFILVALFLNTLDFFNIPFSHLIPSYI